MAKGDTGQTPAAQLAEDLHAISDRCARLPDLDTRSPEDFSVQNRYQPLIDVD